MGLSVSCVSDSLVEVEVSANFEHGSGTNIEEVILVQSKRSLIAGNHNAFQGDGLVSINSPWA